MAASRTAIDRFLNDPKVRKLMELSRETSSLRICYPKEIPVSRFLAWILDPSEGHGLGDAPLRALLAEAWRCQEDADLSPTTRHSLAPTAVAAQPFTGCLIQREVKLRSGVLDVLVLNPRQKWLLAVENKFGAKEGDGQLAGYRRSLAAAFPGWLCVLIFLDAYEQLPSDPAWIGVGYKWLKDEIDTALQLPWLGQPSKTALQQFSTAIYAGSEDFEHVDMHGDLVLEVVNDHQSVFEHMREWQWSGELPQSAVRSIFRLSKTLDDRAQQQLFQVYWSRRRFWGQCIPKLLYAGLLKTARDAFPKIMFDPKRKRTYFSLPEWIAFASDPEDNWPISTHVTVMSPGEGKEPAKYVVASFINTLRIKEELLEQLYPLIQEMRGYYFKRKHPVQEEPGHISLRVDQGLKGDAVGETLLSHIRVLQKAFKPVLERW